MSSSTEDKLRGMVDKVSEEMGLASSEVATTRTDADEGGVSSTMRRRCGPCNIGNHEGCEGEHVCDCDHPSHQPRGQAQAH